MSEWDRSKQSYYISRRGINLWPIVSFREPHEVICSYPAYLYANMNQRDFAREVCFAVDDQEAKEIAIEALEEALKRTLKFPIAVRVGAEKEHIQLEKIKKQARIKALEDELSKLVAEKYMEAK